MNCNLNYSQNFQNTKEKISRISETTKEEVSRSFTWFCLLFCSFSWYCSLFDCIVILYCFHASFILIKFISYLSKKKKIREYYRFFILIMFFSRNETPFRNQKSRSSQVLSNFKTLRPQEIPIKNQRKLPSIVLEAIHAITKKQ